MCMAYRTTNSVKKRKQNEAILNLMVVALCAVQGGLFAICWFRYYRHVVSYGYFYWGHWVITGLYVAIYVLMARIYRGFQAETSRTGELSFSLSIATLLTNGILYVIICLLAYRLVNPLLFLAQTVGGVLCSAVWAWLAVRTADWLNPPLRTVLIYDNYDAYSSVQGVRHMNWRFNVVREIHISALNSFDDAVVEGVEAIFLCGLRSSDRNVLLKQGIAAGVRVYIRPKIGDLLLDGAEQVQFMRMPFWVCQEATASIWYAFFKRMIDIAICGIALLVFSPLFCLVAAFIKLEDGGPVLYRQCRLTTHGKEFYILKFRSMRVDAEKDGVARLSNGDKDPRITRTGRIIRKCRLDELPQLINIIKGDMSIVGPRPERPEIAAQYEEIIPEFRLRLQVKAGLTGYAQVYGKYNTTPYDKLEMDLMYIAKQSIWQDIELMFATIKVLFQSESTEGVAEGQITADRKDADVLP